MGIHYLLYLGFWVATRLKSAQAAAIDARSSALAQNPVGPLFHNGFPSPSIIKVGSTYHAYSTSHGSQNVPTAKSPHLTSGWVFNSTYDALPNPGSWVASQPHVWAPDVNQLAENKFVMYYCAFANLKLYPGVPRHCIGAAHSTSVHGPYTPIGKPLYCGPGGAIDPNGFVDPATGYRYIVHKGGHAKHKTEPTDIMLQRVSPDDGYTPIGPSHTLLTATASEGYDTEGPALVPNPAVKGGFVLYFAINNFKTAQYAINYATSDTLIPAAGKEYKRAAASLLKTGDYGKDKVHLYGPGGPDFVLQGKVQNPEEMIFMAGTGDKFGARYMFEALLHYEGDKVSLVGG